MADNFEIVLSYVAWIFIWSLCFLIGLLATALRIYFMYIEILERRAEVKQSFALDQIVPGSIKTNQIENFIKEERVNIVTGVNPEMDPEESFLIEEEEQMVVYENEEMQETVQEEQAGPSFEFNNHYYPYMGSRPFYLRGLQTTHGEIRQMLEHEAMCTSARNELEILEGRAEVKQSFALDQIVPGSIKTNQLKKFIKEERVNTVTGVNPEMHPEESFFKEEEEQMVVYENEEMQEILREEQAGPSFQFENHCYQYMGSRPFYLRGLETTHGEIRQMLEHEAMCTATRKELKFLERRAEVKQSYALDQIVPGWIKKNQPKKFMKDKRNPEVHPKEEEKEQMVPDKNKKVQESVKKQQAGPSGIKTQKPKHRDPSFEFDCLYDPYMGSRPFYPRGLETTHDEVRKMLEHEAIYTAARQELEILERRAEVKQTYTIDQIVPGSFKTNQIDKFIKEERVNIVTGVNPEMDPEESFLIEEEEQMVVYENEEMQETVQEEQAGPSFEFDYPNDRYMGSRHFYLRGLQTTHGEIRQMLEHEAMCTSARNELEILEGRAEVKQSFALDQIVPGSIKTNQLKKFIKEERVNIVTGVNPEMHPEESFFKEEEEQMVVYENEEMQEILREEQAGPSFEFDNHCYPYMGSRPFYLRGLETTHGEIRQMLEHEAMCTAARKELKFLERRAEVKQSYALDQIVPGGIKKNQPKKFMKDKRNPEVHPKEEEKEQMVPDKNKKVQESVKKQQAGPSGIKTQKPKRRDPSFEFDCLYDPYMGSRPFYPRGLETTHDEVRKMLEHEAIYTAARQELRELDATRDKNRNRLGHDALCRAAQQELYFYNQRLQNNKQKRNK